MRATSQGRLGFCLTLTAISVLSAEAVTAEAKKVPIPRPRPAIHTGKQEAAIPPAASLPHQRPTSANHDNKGGLSSFAQANVGLHGAIPETRTVFKPLARPTAGPFAVSPTTTTSEADIAAVKRVI